MALAPLTIEGTTGEMARQTHTILISAHVRPQTFGMDILVGRRIERESREGQQFVQGQLG